MENFCSILPRHIKHSKINIKIINDMKVILDRLEHLASVTFRILNRKKPWEWQTEIIEWLSKRRDSTYCIEYDILHAWLGKKKSHDITRDDNGQKMYSMN
jgi:hypothetical protein